MPNKDRGPVRRAKTLDKVLDCIHCEYDHDKHSVGGLLPRGLPVKVFGQNRQVCKILYVRYAEILKNRGQKRGDGLSDTTVFCKVLKKLKWQNM